MKVGIAYDLRQDYLAEGYTEEETAEFDRGETIDAIEAALQGFGCETNRIGGIRKLAPRLAGGERWDMVFNIAEGLKGFGREAQVPALLEAYGVPYTFSDPLVLAVSLHKAMTKHVLRDKGVPTPDFYEVESDSDVEGVNLPFPLFAKPVAEGTGKGISNKSKITNKEQLKAVCRELLRVYDQPVLVERFLPGREFTVGILGTGDKVRPVGVMEVVLKGEAEPEVYSYHNKEKYQELVEYRVPEEGDAARAVSVAVAAWKGLGCRDAGRVDLRSDEHGVPNLMEINPLAGLHPEHSDLCIIARQVGMSYSSLIAAIMESAMHRTSSGGMAKGSFRWTGT